MVNLIYFFIIFLLGLCDGFPPQPRSESRIIGGVDAPEDYAPYMVSLISGQHLSCGGSIVSRCHILTAAHCAIPFILPNGTLVSSFYGRAGSKNWKTGGVIITFSVYYIHPLYDAVNIKYDIGVLKMTRRLKLSENVAIISLDFRWVAGGERAYVTGWGRTGPRLEGDAWNLSPIPEELQLLYVWTLGHLQCSRKMEEVASDLFIVPFIDAKTEICTFHSAGHGMCHGDSGSALVLSSTGALVGIVTWGVPCARGAPDVFIRISWFKHYLKPILKTCRC